MEGLTSIPLWYFVLVPCKMLQVVPKHPRATFAQNTNFAFKNVFWGPGLAVVTHATSLKNRETNFLLLTIQEPVFPVSDTEFEGGDDGCGCGNYIFLVK
jgi:hypothetical protein